MPAVPRSVCDRLRRRLARFEQPEARAAAIAAAVLLLVPTLGSGLALDDYKLLAQMNRRGGEAWPGSAPFDLFRWMDPQHNRQFMDGRGFPWWTLESARVAFMRPLSSLTHSVDHWLWPDDLRFMHAHSLLWFALLLAAAARLYAELIDDRWVAGVATLLFAFDPAHGVPAGWLCNRNALLAGAFGAAALFLHHRAQREGRIGAALGACACFALGLSSGELGVGAAGYLIAYALLLDVSPRAARVRSLAPYAVIALVWAVLRSASGYGTYGVDFYVDPVRDPIAFLSALPARWAALIASQSTGVPSDWWSMVPPDVRPVFVAGVLFATAGVAWFAAPSLRADRVCRFWALGAALSAVPIAAALPSDRLLVLVGLGVMPVLAQAMRDAFERVRGAAHGRRLRGTSAAMLVVCRLALAPLLLPLAALSLAALDRATLGVDDSLPKDAAVSGRTVIVTNAPDPLGLSYLPLRREVLNEARPAQLYWLSAAQASLRVERLAPNVLRVSARDGLFSSELERGARSARTPFKRGQHVHLSQLDVAIVSLTADGRPTTCDFTFAHPLESSSYLWKTWRAGQLVNFQVPRVGEERGVEWGG
jgi:hypothetical protein